MLLLLGASGSGKSSLGQAGLIPHLSDEYGTAKLLTLIFVPDRNPFESLYDSLPRKYKEEASEIIQKKEPETLVKLVKNLKEDSYKWLVFIDQFEELFTITPKLERDKFIASLVQLIKQQDSSVKPLIAMRSDFIDNLRNYADLTNEVESQLRLVRDMSEIELRLAIAEPAARNGVTFEKGLVEQIVSDFYQQAGSLPLLQYTLDLLWEKDRISQENRVLNIKTYQDLGGISGALQQQANYIYDKKLNEEEKKAVEKIFLDLIDISEREPISRRAELSIFQEEVVVKSTLNKLIDNRLLVSGRYKSTVEVAHEELLRSWEFVQNLIREKEEIIILKSRLISDAQQWHELKKENEEKAKDELWSGSKLERVLELIEKKNFTILDEQSEQFIQASVEWRERVRAEKIRLQRRILKLLSGGLVVVLLATGVSTWQWFRAEQQRVAAEQQMLRAESQSAQLLSSMGQGFDALMTSLKAGIHLRHAGWRQANPPLAMLVLNALQESVYGVREQNRLEGHRDAVYGVSFSPDGQTLASVSSDHTVKLWNLDGSLRQTLEKHDDEVYQVEFSPNGELLASASADRTVKLWNKDGTFRQTLVGHTDKVYSVAFSPDNQIIASASADGTVKLWNQNGVLLKTLSAHSSGGVRDISFSPDGQTILK